MKTVFRAHFSAITSTDINEAFRNLRLPNRLKSLSVTARQELDLKIGCSFTRFQNSFFHVNTSNQCLTLLYLYFIHYFIRESILV